MQQLACSVCLTGDLVHRMIIHALVLQGRVPPHAFWSCTGQYLLGTASHAMAVHPMHAPLGFPPQLCNWASRITAAGLHVAEHSLV
jgi:hypothetical protein